LWRVVACVSWASGLHLIEQVLIFGHYTSKTLGMRFQKAKQKRLISEFSLFYCARASALETRRSAHVSSALRLCYFRYFCITKEKKI
jgi:hypothetical protein